MASRILIAAPGESVTFPLNDISRSSGRPHQSLVILRDVCDTNRTVGLLNFNLGVWALEFPMGLPWETQEFVSLAMLLAKRRASREMAFFDVPFCRPGLDISPGRAGVSS